MLSVLAGEPVITERVPFTTVPVSPPLRVRNRSPRCVGASATRRVTAWKGRGGLGTHLRGHWLVTSPMQIASEKSSRS